MHSNCVVSRSARWTPLWGAAPYRRLASREWGATEILTAAYQRRQEGAHPAGVTRGAAHALHQELGRWPA